MKKYVIYVEDVVEELASIEEGQGLKLAVWKDGTTAIVTQGYAGEIDGDDPIVILNRDKYEDLSGWEGDADLWDAIQELLNEAIRERGLEDTVDVYRSR